MTLHLVAREVARLNVEHIDQLGAFNEANACHYHYGKEAIDQRGNPLPPDCHCAIGVADINRTLLHSDDFVCGLRGKGCITCSDEDLPVLRFIQNLHDAVVHCGEDGYLRGDRLREYLFEDTATPIPAAVADIVKTIVELDKATYCQIMQELAES